MKVALVACGRLENRYAVEWVEHYINYVSQFIHGAKYLYR